MEGSEGGLETAMATAGTSFVRLSSLFLPGKSTGLLRADVLSVSTEAGSPPGQGPSRNSR